MTGERKCAIWTSTCRIVRFFRMLGLLLVLAVAGFLFYCNYIGLPDFIKRRIILELRHRGLDLEFQKIRFRWDRGVVAEKVKFCRTQLVYGPQVAVDEIAVGLDVESLLRGRIRPQNLHVSGGRVAWQFAGSDLPATPLFLTNVDARLLFSRSPEDCWDLETFNAQFHNANFQISGRITNVSHLQLQRPAGPSAPAQAPDAGLRRLAQTLTNWNFQQAPSVSVKFSADATNLHRLNLALEMVSSQAQIPHAKLRDVALHALLKPSPSGDTCSVSFRVQAGEIETPWAHGREFFGASQADFPWKAVIPSLTTNRLHCRHVQGPWGQATKVVIEAAILAGHTNLVLQAEAIDTPWVKLARAGATGDIAADPADPHRLKLQLRGDFQRPQFASQREATDGRIDISCLFTNYQTPPDIISADLTLRRPRCAYGQAENASFRFQLTPRMSFAEVLTSPASSSSNLLESLVSTNSFITALRWNGDIRNLQWQQAPTLPRPGATNAMLPRQPRVANKTNQLKSGVRPQGGTSLASGADSLPRFECDRVRTAGEWRDQALRVDQFQVDCYGGHLTLTGRYDVISRQLAVELLSSFDWRKLTPFVGTNIGLWLDEFSWSTPPQATLSATATLPDWQRTNAHDFSACLPTLKLAGQIHAQEISARKLSLQRLRAALTLTNQVLDIPLLTLQGRDLDIDMNLRHEFPTGAFAGRANLSVLPPIFGPVFGTNAEQALAMFKFSSRPVVEAEVHGRLDALSNLSASAVVTASNFVFSDVEFSKVHTRVHYANKILSFYQPRAERPGEYAFGDLVRLDFNTMLLYLTNAQGFTTPYVVGKTIGPEVLELLRPYTFRRPPKSRATGVIPLDSDKGADIKFEVDGEAFNWWHFNPTRVSGTVWWLENTVRVTNLVADFYGGKLQGHMFLDFGVPKGADMRLQANFQNVQLNPFLSDIMAQSNKLEGILNGELVVTHANLEDWKSWQGYGKANLRNGIIWELPVFGIFSPILNNISPGLGNSRATAVSASYIITNSLIASTDLQITANPTRLVYEGTVDFDGRLNARVEAEVMDDGNPIGWIINSAFSPVTKLFKYKVTGTLTDPKTKPLYIPVLFLAPFHPIQTIKKIFTPENESGTVKPQPAPPGPSP